MSRTLSLVIPAFNERENLVLLIPEAIEVLSRTGLEYEILLIDDGSTDGTREAAVEMMKRHQELSYVRLEKTRGVSMVLAAGYQQAKGDVIVTIDGDFQCDPADIEKLLEKIDDYDLVAAWRENRNDSLSKRWGSKIANATRRSVIKDGIHDAGCIFRAFRRECLKDIWLFGGFHRFLPALFQFEGYDVTEVRVKHLPRRFGESKYTVANRIWKTTLDMLALAWFERRRIRYTIAERLG
jgi:glycosyltransferase involved in cell wall biosynthesis